MKQFALVYLGGEQPTDPAAAKAHFDKYLQWLTSLGDAVVAPMIPFKDTTTVTTAGEVKPGGASAMSGFSIIKADTMDAALKIAQACPFLEIGGSLEVSELMEMPAQH